jgi:hypothetical protein
MALLAHLRSKNRFLILDMLQFDQVYKSYDQQAVLEIPTLNWKGIFIGCRNKRIW